MAPRVVLLDDMGPVHHRVLAFVNAVFKPTPIKRIEAEAYKRADVLVCGDWRVRVHEGRTTSEHGGTVLAGLLDRGAPPTTLIYALLGKAELARAMRPRKQGVPAIEGWRRVVRAGGRVLVLEVGRWTARRRPFTAADALAAIPTIPAGKVVLWHDPTKLIRV